MFSEIIQKNRENKKFSLEDLSRKTNIPLKIISALENENFSELPPPVYVKGYLKKISVVLETSHEQLWEEFLRARKIAKAQEIDILPSNRFEEKFHLQRAFLKTLRLFPILVAIGAILFFVFYQSRMLFGAPYLKIEKPAIDFITSDPYIKVEGQGRKNSYIKINGKEIYLGRDGKFNEEIFLNPGVNEIKIEASSRLGKSTEIIKRITKE